MGGMGNVLVDSERVEWLSACTCLQSTKTRTSQFESTESTYLNMTRDGNMLVDRKCIGLASSLPIRSLLNSVQWGRPVVRLRPIWQN